MAIEKVIDIVVNTNQAVKEVKSLFNTMVKEQDKVIDGQEDINNNVKELGETAKKSEKGLQSISKGFKGVGLAIKAAGIGLVIGLLGTLQELFMSNQRVANFFATAMETVSVVFNEVTNAVFDAFDTINDATNGFDAFGKVISGIITIGLAPLKVAFLGIKLAVQETQLIWEQSVFGGKDQNTISDLNLKISETKNALVDVAVGVVDAGVTIADNFGKAVDEVGALGIAVVDNISQIDIEASAARAKANVALLKASKIAEAQNRILLEQYDRQAEKLRQIRDNEFKSIAERKKANEELGAVLDKQEKAMIAQANAVLASANAQYEKTRSTEDLVEVMNAQAEIEGVLSTITGLRSEQDANANALLKEEIELNQSKSESVNNLAVQQAQFVADQKTDIFELIDAKREALELEQEIETERLEFNVNKYAEGTQARVDAENELREKLQEFAQIDEELRIEKRDAELERSLEDAENEAIAFEERRLLLDERAKLIASDATLTDDERTKAENENVKARIEISKQETAAKQKAVSAIGDTLATASKLLGESTTAGKVAAVSATTIDTIQSGVSAYKGMVAAIPGPVGIAAGAVAAAGSLKSGYDSVKKILSVKTPNSGGGGSAPSAPTTPSAPAFNLVGNTGTNQIQDTIEQDTTPIQAVVVSSAVTSAQEADRNAIEGATLG